MCGFMTNLAGYSRRESRNARRTYNTRTETDAPSGKPSRKDERHTPDEKDSIVVGGREEKVERRGTGGVSIDYRNEKRAEKRAERALMDSNTAYHFCPGTTPYIAREPLAVKVVKTAGMPLLSLSSQKTSGYANDRSRMKEEREGWGRGRERSESTRLRPTMGYHPWTMDCYAPVRKLRGESFPPRCQTTV